ncbi:MAG: hypothetical protein M3174_03285 [Actinomycetota bacterium]|nr:hypothetical protein [Actinomycetota bacterium]
MAEEVRFFLRIGLYAALITIVYWFVTYEIVGTILLGGLALALGLLIGTILKMRRSSRSDIVPDKGSRLQKTGGAAARVLGFEDESGPALHPPLEAEEEPIVHTSAWPVLTAVCGILLGMGLLFGGWFWIPGLVLGAVTLWGWSSQLRS